MAESDPTALLKSLFDAAIVSAQPALCVPPYRRSRAPGA